MSDKPKFSIDLARYVAKSLLDRLHPYTNRIVIAGSIRREKPMVGDIELLYIPKFGLRHDPNDWFATSEANLADLEIAAMERDGTLVRRKTIDGKEVFGPKNKLMVHVATGIPVDLFATNEQNWWVSLVIRTGSKETNIRLTTGAQQLGARLNAYGCGITLENGRVVPATSERHLFELCGVPYCEPSQR